MNQSERSKGNQEGTRRRTRSSSLCPSKAFRVDDKLTKELKVPWKSFDSIFAIKIILIKHTDGFDRSARRTGSGWVDGKGRFKRGSFSFSPARRKKGKDYPAIYGARLEVGVSSRRERRCALQSVKEKERWRERNFSIAREKLPRF